MTILTVPEHAQFCPCFLLFFTELDFIHLPPKLSAAAAADFGHKSDYRIMDQKKGGTSRAITSCTI